jgi:hypothetical protein
MLTLLVKMANWISKLILPRLMLTSTEKRATTALKIDSEKVDVEVTKDDVKLDVNDQNNLLGKILKWIFRKRL